MLTARSPTNHLSGRPGPESSSTADGMIVFPSIVNVRTPFASPTAATVFVVPKSTASTHRSSTSVAAGAGAGVAAGSVMARGRRP
jgi:hypothetical protein